MVLIQNHRWLLQLDIHHLVEMFLVYLYLYMLSIYLLFIFIFYVLLLNIVNLTILFIKFFVFQLFFGFILCINCMNILMLIFLLSVVNLVFIFMILIIKKIILLFTFSIYFIYYSVSIMYFVLLITGNVQSFMLTYFLFQEVNAIGLGLVWDNSTSSGMGGYWNNVIRFVICSGVLCCIIGLPLAFNFFLKVFLLYLYFNYLGILLILLNLVWAAFMYLYYVNGLLVLFSFPSGFYYYCAAKATPTGPLSHSKQVLLYWLCGCPIPFH